MADFGIKPKVGRVFVRVQEIDETGKVKQTQSMNVWGASFTDVLMHIEAQLTSAFGNGSATEEKPPIKAKVGKGLRGRRA